MGITLVPLVGYDMILQPGLLVVHMIGKRHYNAEEKKDMPLSLRMFYLAKEDIRIR
jgi:hypothetical protein